MNTLVSCTITVKHSFCSSLDVATHSEYSPPAATTVCATILNSHFQIMCRQNCGNPVCWSTPINVGLWIALISLWRVKVQSHFTVEGPSWSNWTCSCHLEILIWNRFPVQTWRRILDEKQNFFTITRSCPVASLHNTCAKLWQLITHLYCLT